MGFGIISLPQIIAMCPNTTIPRLYCNITDMRQEGYSEIYLSLAYGSLNKVGAILMVISYLTLFTLSILTFVKFVNNVLITYSFRTKVYILTSVLISILVFLIFFRKLFLVCFGTFLFSLPILILLWSCINVIYLKRPPLFKLTIFKPKYIIAISLICLSIFIIRTIVASVAPERSFCNYEYACKPEELPF